MQHAIVGAALAWRSGIDSLPIALAVQAHHGALKTLGALEDAVANTGTHLLSDAERDGLPRDVIHLAVPALPAGVGQDRPYLALATRFLFSALVDADSLDTEAWDRATERDTGYSSISELAR